MKPILIVTLAAAFGLAVGGCASGPKNGETANAAAKEKSRPWWKIPDSLKKQGFDYWTYGEVRKGPGLLSKDEDGFVVYNQPTRGSEDPSKPEKVRR